MREQEVHQFTSRVKEGPTCFQHSIYEFKLDTMTFVTHLKNHALKLNETIFW